MTGEYDLLTGRLRLWSVTMTGGLELGGFAILVLWWAHAGYGPAGMTRGLEGWRAFHQVSIDTHDRGT